MEISNSILNLIGTAPMKVIMLIYEKEISHNTAAFSWRKCKKPKVVLYETGYSWKYGEDGCSYMPASNHGWMKWASK